MSTPLNLVHYSAQDNLSQVDPKKMGTSGISGAQYKRGLPENKTSFFYTHDSNPEDMVLQNAKHMYTATLGPEYKVYDADKDPQNLKQLARSKNNGAWNEDIFHDTLKEKGYHGLKWEMRPNTHVVQMYVPVNVQKELKKSAPEVKINPEHGKIIANAYENMKHEPNNPKVKEAYSALINETKQQYQDMLNQGFKFTPMKSGQPNPYKTSKDVHNDLEQNKHLHYFPTKLGYGTENSAPKDHPMLQLTEFKDAEGDLMPANDLFRIVHDYRGHFLGGKSSFGPKGEHQAFLTHKKDFSPLAQKALATETMGQNSWVTAGPHAEHNKKNPENTIYAEQKAGLLPDSIINSDWHK